MTATTKTLSSAPPRVTLINTKEAAEYLHKTPGSLRQSVYRREIPYRKIGRKVLFVLEELQAWIDSNPESLTLDELRSARPRA